MSTILTICIYILVYFGIGTFMVTCYRLTPLFVPSDSDDFFSMMTILLWPIIILVFGTAGILYVCMKASEGLASWLDSKHGSKS